jgi:tRNA nucleotidyltransferase (CCA-adding enzyme)
VQIFGNADVGETLHERVSAATNDVCFYETVPATEASLAERKHTAVKEAIFHTRFIFNQTRW